MKPMFFIPDSFIEDLMDEDLHILDVTTAALGIENEKGSIECFPKRGCVVAGLDEAARVFEKTGAVAKVLCANGSFLEAGTICMKVQGTAGALHAVYKIAQNIMEYSSGIAMRCRTLVRNARQAAPRVEVAVTRKHFPGTKLLSLKAALAGGASIHRLGLFDSILVFDQHREFTGGSEGFRAMVREVGDRFPEKKVVAEAQSPEEALAFVRAGVDVVQCEKFAPRTLQDTVAAIRQIDPRVKISAAGGIDADNAADYAATGVDVLVTSWVYFGKPEDIKMRFSAESVTGMLAGVMTVTLSDGS
jgi:molybdenum transport protein